MLIPDLQNRGWEGTPLEGIHMAAMNPHAARAAATLTIIVVSVVVKEADTPQGTDWLISILQVIGVIVAGLAAVGTLILAIAKYRDKKVKARRKLAG